MGLGGMLTWTAAIRELYNYYGKIVFPCEFDGSGNYVKPVESDMFLNNPYCYNGEDVEEIIYLPTNIFQRAWEILFCVNFTMCRSNDDKKYQTLYSLRYNFY